VLDGAGQVGEIYGRKVRTDLHAGTPLHLYLPGSHRGVFNPAAFTAGELIVCESLIDALSLWCAGFRHVTASYGTGGWTAGHTALAREHKVSRVLIAYDGDPAGDQGAASLAAELAPLGAQCLRVPLPGGADINDVAVQSRVPRDALGVLLRHAAPVGQLPATGTAGMRRTGKPATRPGPAGHDAGAGAGAAQAVQAGSGAGPGAPPAQDTGQAPQAGSAGGHRDPPALPGPEPGAAGTDAGDGELAMVHGDRRWRVRGLDKATSHGALRVNVLAARGERFHIDTLDLYSARARQAFITAAAAELGVSADIVKADLGKVLLASESRAEQAITAARTPKAAQAVMTDAERAEALALLADPDLPGRIEADFAAAGIAGESAGCLALYLAAVSRKLDRPLAVIVQSSSAAGKSALMDAALAFVPEEDTVIYSAMTGQSLFYLGDTDLAHKMLAIAEEEGASRASYALKLLQSEGRLSIASTGKDPDTGALVTRSYQVTGPAAIMLTTTSIDVDEELLNRCLVLAVDEDAGQTRAIHAAQRHARTLDGLAARVPAGAGDRGAPQRPAADRPGHDYQPVRGPADVLRCPHPHPPRPRQVPDPDRGRHPAAPAPAAAQDRPHRRPGRHLHRDHPGRHRDRQPARPRDPGPVAGRAAPGHPPPAGCGLRLRHDRGRPAAGPARPGPVHPPSAAGGNRVR
jgi:DNA primase